MSFSIATQYAIYQQHCYYGESRRRFDLGTFDERGARSKVKSLNKMNANSNYTFYYRRLPKKQDGGKMI